MGAAGKPQVVAEIGPWLAHGASINSLKNASSDEIALTRARPSIGHKASLQGEPNERFQQVIESVPP